MRGRFMRSGKRALFGVTPVVLALSIGAAPARAEVVGDGDGRVMVPDGVLMLQVMTNTWALLADLKVRPRSIIGGTSGEGTVRLTGPDLSGGATVLLASDHQGIMVMFPETVTVPEGAATATFTIESFRVSNPRSVTVSAAYEGLTRTASFRVDPRRVLTG